MSNTLNAYIDGACSGNPGDAAIGVVIIDGNKKIKEISRQIGLATNNIAEYSAVITAMKEALELKASNIKIFTDSELVFKQLIGSYKINNEKLKMLFDEIQQLIKGFEHVDIEKIPREQNKDADKLAKQALKKKQVKVSASTFRLK